jgi:hypothetical protein
MALTVKEGTRRPTYPKPPIYSAKRSIFRGPKGAPRPDTVALLKNQRRTIIPNS